MRYLAAIALTGALVVAGCGGTKVATNPQALEAQKVVETCIHKGGSKTALETCIAPPGHTAALTSCAITAAEHNFYSQPKLVAALAKCVERDR